MSFKGRKFYTKAECKKIKELATAGMSNAEIGAIMGKTASAIRGFLWRRYPNIVPTATKKLAVNEPEKRHAPPEPQKNVPKGYDIDAGHRIGYKLAGIYHIEYNPRSEKIAPPGAR